MMKKSYIKPEMNARWFGDRIVTAGTGAGDTTASVAVGVTAAQDLTNQFHNYMIQKGTTGTISTVKLESIIGYQQ